MLGCTWLCTHYPLIDAAGAVYAIGAIHLDITDRIRAERELRSAQAVLEQQAAALARTNEELTELDRLKNDFVASVSHELRTPLTSIRGYTELLLAGKAGDLAPAQGRIVEIVDTCAQNLHALIEDLLTMVSMNAGGFRMARAPVALARLVDKVVSTVAPSVASGGLKLTVDVAPDLPLVLGDPRQLERVLANLVVNAVKFTRPGGTVTITAAGADGEVTVAVADTGIGIPPAEQAGVFDRFYRASTAREGQIQGTGLGLAIVKNIVEQHGGRIGLSSEPGVGTTVMFGLPALEVSRR